MRRIRPLPALPFPADNPVIMRPAFPSTGFLPVFAVCSHYAAVRTAEDDA